MKLLTFLLLVSVASVTANSYSQQTKFKMSLENATVRQVFQEIEKSSEFIFIYSEKTVDVNRKVDIKVEDETVTSILDQLFKGTDNYFEIRDRQIMILSPEMKGVPSQIISGGDVEQPQKKKLTGKVTDAKGIGIPATTVMVKGSTIGIITDFDGNFSLDVPLEAKTLSFSFIGFESQEVEIGSNTTFSIVLKEKTVGLEEVVAVGYGVQKKATVVGAISTISGAQIMKTGGVSSLSTALTGMLPGLVTIQSNMGQPGSENAKLIIRSITSWNGSDPLVLVDGIKRAMNDIDPNDVENISILKDASATAVYGVEGANGVILISTKRGKSGKTQLTFSGNVTMKAIAGVDPVLDSYQGLSVRNQAIMNEVGMNPSSFSYYMPQEVLNHYRDGDNPYVYPSNNWMKYFTSKPGLSQKAGFTLTGGTDFIKYFGSFSYLHEGDIFSLPDSPRGYDPSYSYNRFNFRTNLDFKLTKTTNLAVNLSGYRGSQKSPGGSNAMGIVRMLGTGAPDIAIQYEDGIWASNPTIGGGANPILNYNYKGVTVANTTNFTTDFALSQDLNFITKGLKADIQFSYDNSISSSGPSISDVGSGGIAKFIDPVKYTAARTDAERAAAATWEVGGGVYSPVQGLPTISAESYGGSFNKRLVYQGRLNYARDFGKHAVSGLAVFKRQQGANASAWPDYREDWVGRVTYGYDRRYFFEANGAYNGSEKFGPGYRFGFFPSLSGGWTFSNEKFIKEHLSFLSLGKIRYSNGKVGSDAGIPRWLYDSQLSSGPGLNQIASAFTGYQLGYPTVSINSSYKFFNQSVIGNPDAHWETAHKQNIGLETSYFDNLIAVNIDHYWEKRTGIFMSSGQRTSIPSWFGANPVASNLGETEGQGWEVELKLNKTNNKGLHYYVNANWAFNTDKVIYMEDALLQDDYQKRQGFAIGQPKYRVNDGFYNSWDDVYSSVLDGDNTKIIPGQFKQIDFNADGKLDAFDAIPYGYPTHPQATYSATFGSDYKGFSAMVQFYGTYNYNINFSVREFGNDNGANYWTSTHGFNATDAWTSERAANGTATYMANAYRVQNSASGTYFLKDASYLRLKTAEIAYTFDKSLLSRLGVAKTRLFLNGNNLIYWSKLASDLEENSSTSGLGTNYPTLRRYNLGVEITF